MPAAPLRLAHLVGQLSLGGAEQQLYHLAAGLDPRRYRVQVISLGPRPDEYWALRLQEIGIPVAHLPRSLGRLGRLARLARLLKESHADLIHSWDIHTNPYAALAAPLAGVRYKVGSMRLNYAILSDHPALRWLGFSGLDVLVANSAAARDQAVSRRLTRARVELAPNGVEIPALPEPAQRARLRHGLGYTPKDLVIATIGRLDENKNHLMLLRVFARLVQQFPGLRLLIIGEGPLHSDLLALAERLGVADCVTLPGAIPLAAHSLPAADICCLTSISEGMPNLVMEASAAALPVVSTRCGGAVELIEDGVTGWLAEVGDEAGYENRLASLIADAGLRRQMGQAGRERMAAEFSIARMIERMTAIYSGLIARRDGRV